MYNLYSKKATSQGYDSQNVVQVIKAECKNTESKCNFCGGKIYWNPCVIHRHTGKHLPLSKPFNAYGTTPVAHRGCVYNADNFYEKVVIHDNDSKFVKQKKMQIQDKLFGVVDGLSEVQRLLRDRTPEEKQRCDDFVKHCTDTTYDPNIKSGVDYSKKVKEVRVRK